MSRIRKGEELKALRHVSAAVLCDDYITIYNIVLILATFLLWVACVTILI